MNATTREAPPEGHLLNETEWLTLRALADVSASESPCGTAPGIDKTAFHSLCEGQDIKENYLL